MNKPLVGKTKLTQPIDASHSEVLERLLDHHSPSISKQETSNERSKDAQQNAHKASNKTFRFYREDIIRLEKLVESVSKLSRRQISQGDIVRAGLALAEELATKDLFEVIRDNY